MTVPSNLTDIRSKVRKLTARTSITQITDAQIDSYVNSFYLYDLPESLRILKLDDVYTFFTQPNIETYPFPSNNYTLNQPPCYAAGQQMNYFESDDIFYREWPKTNFIQDNVAVGNGTNGPYTGQITGVPFLRSVNPSNVIAQVGQNINVTFSAITGFSTAIVAIDDGNGNFLAPNVGTINYETGVFNITFNAIVPAGNSINATVIPYAASIPRSMLFWQNQFVLRPVPDQVYPIQVNVQRVPAAFINSSDNPELNEWWELIAFGASRKLLIDNGDYNTLANIQPYYEERLVLALRRSIKEGASQRASTIYSDMNSLSYSNQYPYI